MSEAEIIQGLFSVIDAVLVVFSTFFAIVSGYVAALFFFLARAPVLLRTMAFLLLSVGLAFLGGTATVIQTLQDGLLASWERIQPSSVAFRDLRNPLPNVHLANVTQHEIGIAIGWVVALAVYLALFYLTFIYRWPTAEAERQR